jgi:hypothetical protein
MARLHGNKIFGRELRELASLTIQCARRFA